MARYFFSLNNRHPRRRSSLGHRRSWSHHRRSRSRSQHHRRRWSHNRRRRSRSRSQHHHHRRSSHRWITTDVDEEGRKINMLKISFSDKPMWDKIFLFHLQLASQRRGRGESGWRARGEAGASQDGEAGASHSSYTLKIFKQK